MKKDDKANKWKSIANRNHNMLLAQSKVFALSHQMFSKNKIGPTPNISICYPNSNHPLDVLFSKNAQALLHRYYLDVVVRGKYNKVVLKFLKEKDALIEITEEDLKTFRKGKPDFIAFDYYNSLTIKSYDETHNKKGDQQSFFSIDGFFTPCKNPNLGKTEFGWEIDPIGFRTTFR